MSIQIPPTFDVNGSAMVTPEKRRMMASSTDEAETAAEQIIADGASGITVNVVSSAHLSRALHIRGQTSGFDVPRGPALNHMLTRLGYSKLDKYVRWGGQTHTIWLRNGVEFTNDQIRLELEKHQSKFQFP